VKRKDVGKRQGGLWSKAVNFVLGAPVPTEQEAILGSRHGATISSMPAQFDDTPLGGDRVVGGVHCKTVGEYKAACAKFYGPECSE
jgi:hypothetical protein